MSDQSATSHQPGDGSPDAASMAALSPEDAALLDALIEADFDVNAMSGLSAEQQSRAHAIGGVFAALDAVPVEEPDVLLVDATLARIAQHDSTAASRMKLDPAEAAAVSGGWRGFRLPDFISIAAGLLIVAGVSIPILSAAKHRSQVAGCADNLRQVGTAFSQYADDYNGALPMQASVVSGLSSGWDRVRNIVNLTPLVEHGYCEHGCLKCPGHVGDGPSYSYQWQSTGDDARWNGASGGRIIMGDKNPLIELVERGDAAPALSVSINHRARGQNVLRMDNSTQWTESPIVDGDNIWLPGDASELKPGMPVPSGDVFLTH